MLLKSTGRAYGAWIAAATILVLTGGQACGILDDNGACPLLDPPGILIDVVDASSGRFVPRSANPTGFAIRGSVREPMLLVSTVPGQDRTQLSGGKGPPGARSEVVVYDVEITAEGYEPWRTSGIPVRLHRCGYPTRTVEMTARLLPSPPAG